jgi:hypothetical protein
MVRVAMWVMVAALAGPAMGQTAEPSRQQGDEALRQATAAAVGAAVWLLAPARPRVADLPALIDHEPRDLFATLDLPSTDGLLPSHLTVVMP